jgi:hypothetical protein
MKTTFVAVAFFLMRFSMNNAAFRPSPLDVAFTVGDEKAVTDAIVNSEQFKRAVGEAVKARDARKATVKDNPKGATPEQAGRVRFFEVLEGS